MSDPERDPPELEGPDKEFADFLEANSGDFDRPDQADERKIEDLLELLRKTSQKVPREMATKAYEIVCSHQQMKIIQLKADLQTSENENEILKSSESEYREENAQLLEQLKNIVSAMKNPQESAADDSSQVIKDLTTRIELIRTQSESQMEKMTAMIIELENKNNDLSDENMKMQESFRMADVEREAILHQFGDALNVQSIQSAPEIISAFRENLKIHNSDISIHDFFREVMGDSDLLHDIFSEFNLQTRNLEQIVEEIKAQLEPEKDGLREEIEANLGLKGTTDEIIETLQSWSTELDLFLDKVTEKLGIPADSPEEEILDVIARNNDEQLVSSPYKSDSSPQHQQRQFDEQFKMETDYEERLLQADETIRGKDIELQHLGTQLSKIEQMNKMQNDEITTLKAENMTLQKEINEADERTKLAQSLADDSKDDLQTLIQNKAVLIKKADKLSSRIAELENQLTNEIAKRESIDLDLNTANLKNESLELEIEDLTNRLSNLNQTENVFNENQNVDHIVEVVTSITNQLHNQSEELSCEADQRNKLVASIFKQQQIIAILEQKIKELNESIETNHFEKLEIGTEYLELMVQAIGPLSESPVTDKYSKEILDIAVEEEPVGKRLCKAIQVLVTAINVIRNSDTLRRTDSQLACSNARLLGFLHSQLRYIQKIASEEVVNEKDVDDIHFLKQNAIQVQEFIESNCSGFTEENYLFEFLDDDCDPMKMVDTVESILSAHENPEESDPKELFAALCQAVAANQVLRRYSSEVHLQCVHQTTEIKTIRAQSQSLQANLVKDYEAQITQLKDNLDDETARREELEESMQTTLGRLKQQENDDSPAEVISRDISHSGIGEEKFERTLVDLEESHKEESKEMSQMQITELNDEQTKQFEEIIQDCEEKAKLIASLQEELEALKAKDEDLMSELSQKQEEIDLLSKEKELALLESDMKSKNHEQEIESIKTSLTDKFQKREELLTDNFNEKKQIYKETIRSKEIDLKRAQDAAAEKERRIAALEDFKSNILAEQRRRATESHQAELQAVQMIQKLKQQLSEANSKQTAAELDARLAKSRLKTVEEQAAREKSKFESQFTLHSLSQETMLRQKADNIRRTTDDDERSFLVDICHIFKEFADFSQPITRSSVKDLLNRVKKAVEDEDSKAAQSTPGHITRIVNKLRQAQKEIDIWHEWAKDLVGEEKPDEELRKSISTFKQ